MKMTDAEKRLLAMKIEYYRGLGNSWSESERLARLALGMGTRARTGRARPPLELYPWGGDA
jgi:hypothetical protein